MDDVSRRARERLVREEEITEAAERIFIGKGFEDASMDEIAKAAQFTKRTLYQYFRSKEDLYLAVVLRGFKLMVGKLSVAGAEGTNGIGRIRLSFRALYGFYREHPETFKLISQWSYVKRRSLEENPAMEQLQSFNRQMLGQIAVTLREGIADGSVRSGLAVEATVLRLVFLITGFLTQLVMTGESFTRQFSLDPEEFGLSAIDMVLDSLEPRTR
jgi:AcrR family transcriptional regulator